MSKLVLATGEKIAIEDGAYLGAMSVVTDSKTEMVEIWDKLTDAALETAQIEAEDGTVTGRYELLTCRDNVSSGIRKDGKILTVFPIREMTENEQLRAEVEALKKSQQVQDGAIDDLGMLTSELAEKAEGGAQ